MAIAPTEGECVQLQMMCIHECLSSIHIILLSQQNADKCSTIPHKSPELFSHIKQQVLEGEYYKVPVYIY